MTDGAGLRRPASGNVTEASRRRLGSLALLCATLTGAAVAGLGGSVPQLYGGLVYLGIAAVSLRAPGAIATQVVVGQLLVASLLVGPGAPHPLLALPLVAGVVATAELLGGLHRLDKPLEREAGGDLRGIGTAVAVAGSAYGAVALLGAIPGPTGLLAVALASAACVGMALLFARRVA